MNNHLGQFMNPAVDAAIAMTTFMCAAESKGLSCCPVSSIRDTPFELARLLHLPRFVFPVAGLVVGHAVEDALALQSLRLPQSVTVMVNEYRSDPENILAEVEDYSARREAARPTSPDAQRHREAFGVAPTYGWTEDKTRQYALPARTDWGDFIRSQGFELE